MQIIKRIEGWVETEDVLGELLNGFRSGRRLDDNIFALTRGIEIAEKGQRPLWLAFLDIRIYSYDNVSQEKMYVKLE